MKVGQRVEEKYSGCKGTVELVQPGHAMILWDNGFQDIVHVSYMRHIVLLDTPEDKGLSLETVV